MQTGMLHHFEAVFYNRSQAIFSWASYDYESLRAHVLSFLMQSPNHLQVQMVETHSSQTIETIQHPFLVQ